MQRRGRRQRQGRQRRTAAWLQVPDFLVWTPGRCFASVAAWFVYFRERSRHGCRYSGNSCSFVPAAP